VTKKQTNTFEKAVEKILSFQIPPRKAKKWKRKKKEDDNEGKD